MNYINQNLSRLCGQDLKQVFFKMALTLSHKAVIPEIPEIPAGS